ncbi:MAG: hypothetical protein IPP08_05015 [Chlorobiota bacterium]|jgi:hypothetical protein|nr:hypothetical protein [Chlorobiota bacterium]QQS67529.1 MAG: hypothetical protein IPP08_05015 [Chlorobiota bacterium]
MAKAQTFDSKSKKKAAEFISVKVITSDKTEKGSYRFQEKFIKLKDINDIEKAIKL